MFDLLFLGTCAADFSPKLKTEFLHKFDFDARRASCALMDGKYLIDCGPHVMEALAIANVSPNQITDIFITHLHDDHFVPENIEKIAAMKNVPLKVWVRAEAVLPKMKNVEVVYLETEKTQSVNAALSVTGLKSNHNQDTFPQWLLFEGNDKKFLYATDGAWFLYETYYYLWGKELDLIALDATCGDYNGDFRMAEHNSIPMIKMMLASLKTAKILKDTTKVYLTHLAPSLHVSHMETVEIVKPYGLKVAYDGLKIQI